MPLARWRDSMSLDYPPLDDEQKAFLQVVNASYMAVQAKDLSGIEGTFKECYAYVRAHLSHEENLMQKMRFPDIENHMKAHQVFISKLAQMKQAFDAAQTSEEQQTVALHFSNFLNVWFLAHITGPDRLLKPYLRRLRMKNNPR